MTNLFSSDIHVHVRDALTPVYQFKIRLMKFSKILFLCLSSHTERT